MGANSEGHAAFITEMFRHVRNDEWVRGMVSDSFVQHVPLERLADIVEAVEMRYGTFSNAIWKDQRIWLCFERAMLQVAYRMDDQDKLDYLYIFPKKTFLSSVSKVLPHSALWMKLRMLWILMVGLGVPAIFAYLCWTTSIRLVDHVFVFVDMIVVSVFYVLCLTWAGVGTFIRNVWYVVCLSIGILSFVKPSYGGFGRIGTVGTAVEVTVAVVFAALSIRAIAGRTYKGEPVRLDFPFKTGNYMVFHGGSNTWVNYHGKYVSHMRYALDIVKVNVWGMRARGVFPSSLDDFYIFGESVYSPCSGTVVEAVDHFADQPAPNLNAIPPAGNYITLSVGDYRVSLAHLQQGSVLVQDGDRVVAGQHLARVGHTGNSSEPHLHMHVTSESVEPVPVPMTFNGRYYARNMIIHANKMRRSETSY